MHGADGQHYQSRRLDPDDRHHSRLGVALPPWRDEFEAKFIGGFVAKTRINEKALMRS
jgi:hypothetical protein